MCIGAVNGEQSSYKDIVKMAVDIMEPREEYTYAKGILAYDAWKEKWFDNNAAFDGLFEKLLVQNDAMVCIQGGRKWGAKFFEQVSAEYGKKEAAVCASISKHFNKVSAFAGEMKALLGDWGDMDNMMRNLASRSVREKLGRLIDAAKEEDNKAFEEIRLFYSQM